MEQSSVTVTGPAPSISRLRWECRRGMKELDLVLRRYLDRDYEVASPDLQQSFSDLLKREDPEIWVWIIGYEPPPAEFAMILDEVRRYT